jgi:Raf kinase inhibitor-like YbhB/YbcL family protein
MRAEKERAMRAVGELLRPIRPGVDALASFRFEGFLGNALTVTSPAFKEGDAIPRAFTADGEGRFPGVSWDGLPAQTQSVVLLVEDADVPFVRPVTHAIVHSIPPDLGGLEPGAVPRRMAGPSPAGWACGRNFLGRTGWAAPSPPPGHGAHRYAFQVFALNAGPRFPHPPGRTGLLRRIRPHLIAQGRLIGTYTRA